MALLAAIVLVAVFWTAIVDLAGRMPKAQGAKLRGWLIAWRIKGLGVPFLIWTLFNCGFSEYFPPLMLKIQAATPGLDTIVAFIDVLGVGLYVIATYWTAMTLGWLLAVLAEQVNDRQLVKNLVASWSVILVPVAGLLVYGFGWTSAGLAAITCILPLIHLILPLAFAPKRVGDYSLAITQLHRDKHEEAEAAVLAELEKAEDDFAGWLILAELYVNHFDDLAGAERIIHESCAHPDATPSEICVGLNRLADWHLKPGDNPTAARRALEEIVHRFPGTSMEREARIRVSKLPADREELLKQREPRKISLPSLGRQLDPGVAVSGTTLTRSQASARANECVQKLTQNPDNMAVREELARILAEQLGKVEFAIEQVEQLLGMANVPPEKAAAWMGMAAAWQIKYLNDPQTGRMTMERLIHRFPKSPEAFAAQRRINLMELEDKMRAARAAAAGGAKRPALIVSLVG